MSFLGLDPGDPNNWYQSPQLGLFPTSPTGYSGGYYCLPSSHPHGTQFATQTSYRPPPPSYLPQPLPSHTIINGYVFPHQFPSTHTYHSPNSDPNPWIYRSISQSHSYDPSVPSVNLHFVSTKTIPPPPIYHSAPSPPVCEQPHTISYPNPLCPIPESGPSRISLHTDRTHNWEVPIVDSGSCSLIPEPTDKLKGAEKPHSPPQGSDKLQESLKSSMDTFISEFREERRLLRGSLQSPTSQVDNPLKFGSPPSSSTPKLIPAATEASSSLIPADNGIIHKTDVDSGLNLSHTDVILRFNDNTSTDHVVGLVFGIDENLENGDGESSDKRAKLNSADGKKLNQLEGVSVKEDDQVLSWCRKKRECNANENGKGILENGIEYDQNHSTPVEVVQTVAQRSASNLAIEADKEACDRHLLEENYDDSGGLKTLSCQFEVIISPIDNDHFLRAISPWLLKNAEHCNPRSTSISYHLSQDALDHNSVFNIVGYNPLLNFECGLINSTYWHLSLPLPASLEKIRRNANMGFIGNWEALITYMIVKTLANVFWDIKFNMHFLMMAISHATTVLTIMIATNCQQLTNFVASIDNYQHLDPSLMVAALQNLCTLACNNEPICVLSYNEKTIVTVPQVFIQMSKAAGLFHYSRVSGTFVHDYLRKFTNEIINAWITDSALVWTNEIITICQPRITFCIEEVIDFLQINSKFSSSRYTYGPVVSMPAAATQFVVHLICHAWLLLIHAHKHNISMSTSFLTLPYFALGTTSHVFESLSVIFVNTSNYKKAAPDVIGCVVIFYVAYVLFLHMLTVEKLMPYQIVEFPGHYMTKKEIATFWIWLPTTLLRLQVWVLNLHGLIGIKAKMLIGDALLIKELMFDNVYHIIPTGAVVTRCVCHFGGDLHITNSYSHMDHYNICWLQTKTKVILLENTYTWAYFQVAFDYGLTFVLGNVNDDFHMVYSTICCLFAKVSSQKNSNIIHQVWIFGSEFFFCDYVWSCQHATKVNMICEDHQGWPYALITTAVSEISEISRLVISAISEKTCNPHVSSGQLSFGGLFNEHEEHFEDITASGILPNVMRYYMMHLVYAKIDRWDDAAKLLNEMLTNRVSNIPKVMEQIIKGDYDGNSNWQMVEYVFGKLKSEECGLGMRLYNTLIEAFRWLGQKQRAELCIFTSSHSFFPLPGTKTSSTDVDSVRYNGTSSNATSSTIAATHALSTKKLLLFLLTSCYYTNTLGQHTDTRASTTCGATTTCGLQCFLPRHELGADVISSYFSLVNVDDLTDQYVALVDFLGLKKVLSLGGDLLDGAGTIWKIIQA